MPSASPLFYKSVALFDRDLHGSKKLVLGPKSFSFSAETNIVPAVLEEFGAACRHLPIVFMPHEKNPTAVFLVGVREGQNLFVDQDGAWRGAYVPAYIRRYPFIAGDVTNSDPVLCLDLGSPLLSDTEGEPLVVDGKETDLLRERITFVGDYLAAANRTDAAGALLLALDLFQTITVDFRASDGSTHSVQGLWAVDEAKLNALPEEKFLDLRRHGLLGPIYGHLVSLASIDKFAELENVSGEDGADRDRKAKKRA